MLKTIYNPLTLAPPVGHFERAVRLGDWLFISGTSALTNVSGAIETRRLVEGIEAQTRETLDNIERVLVSAGVGFEQVYEIRFILKTREDFATVNRVIKARLPKGGFVAHGYEGTLLHPKMLVEIEANAFLGPVERVERVGRT